MRKENTAQERKTIPMVPTFTKGLRTQKMCQNTEIRFMDKVRDKIVPHGYIR